MRVPERDDQSLSFFSSLVNGVGGIRTPVLTHLCIVYYMFSLLSRLFPEKRDISGRVLMS